MPEFRPISTVRFATAPGTGAADGNNISTKIAPPYDVLDEGPKQDLLAHDRHNIVAIDLPVTPPKTVGPDAAYQAAGELYRHWLDEGYLRRDDRPSVVAYEQDYIVNGQTLRRRGLFCGLKVEEFNRTGGGVFQHEKTIAGGIGDRTKLMQATNAQLSPIFGTFNDPHSQVVNTLGEWFDTEPDFYGNTPGDGVLHRCWHITDPDTLHWLGEFFQDTNVFIADGHHRYTTALQFSKDHPDLPGADTCLFVLVAAEDPGMIVLPTHRVVCGLDRYDLGSLKKVIAQRDDLELTDDAKDARFGIFDPATGQTLGLNTTGPDPLGQLFPDKPDAWRGLDVAVLHELIIDRILKPAFGSDDVSYKYTADLDTMKQLATAEPGRLGIVMQFTPLQSVIDVSLANEIMPAKSTYFFPKLATGLVINPLD